MNASKKIFIYQLLINNLIALSLGLLMFISELAIRKYLNILDLDNITNIILSGWLLSILMLYSKSTVVAIITATFICLSYAIEYANISYFGHWISPITLWLMIIKFNEVWQTSSTIFFEMYFTIYNTMLVAISTFIVIRLRKREYKKYSIVTFLTIFVLLIFPLLAVINPNYQLGLNPKLHHNLIKSSIYATGYFIGKTIPEELFGISKVKPFTAEPIELVSQGHSDNIVIIMGESLSSEYISAYGFNLKTTPWLDNQKNQNNALIKNGFSGALYTDVSVPFFMNLIERPNGVKQVASYKNNLYKMAKDNGYTTYFFTTQQPNNISFVNNIGRKWIDVYKSPYAVVKNKPVALKDEQLITWFNEIDLDKKNFIVLNQNGSHEPYPEKSPANFKVFGTDSLYKEYMNSIRYTDYIWKSIYDELQKKSARTWSLFITSDHGQHVTQQSFGKGSFKYPSNYMVPVYASSNSKNVIEMLKNNWGNCEYVFQYQLSSSIAAILGYKVIPKNCKYGYVSGSRMSGNNGYLKIEQDGKKFKSDLILPE